MPYPAATTKRNARNYADLLRTREECMSILECRGADIRHIPEYLLDAALVRLALRNGASVEDLPPSFR